MIIRRYERRGARRVYVGEFEAETFDGTNEALSGSASASSTHPGYPASNTIDGATTNWWDANPTADPDAEEWLKIDLGSSMEIEHLDFFWYHIYWPPRHAYVQVSNNGSDWQNIAEISHESVPISYPERYETVPVRQTASWASGVTWSDNHGEEGVGTYAREFEYDKVGNRTLMHLLDDDGDFVRDVTWTLEYNDFNQLDKRYTGASWSTGNSGDQRIDYTYDDNGNLTQALEETYSGGWSETLKWEYEWNPRDQMTRAEKSVNQSYVGKVEYEYCLSCDGALSKRFEYDDSNDLVSGRRYEYDGLNLLRVDQLYDDDKNGLDEVDEWRTTEVNTHRPGTLGALLGKRVYTYSSGTTGTPSGYNDYSYAYDAVGNVVTVFHDSGASDGDEAFYFTQDAFGNELEVNTLGESDWATARTAGVTEHQTGKWMDEFTGLYYFHARWLDAGVGRFVGRDKYFQPLNLVHPNQHPCGGCSFSSTVVSPIPTKMEHYLYCRNNPLRRVDSTGNVSVSYGTIGDIIEDIINYIEDAATCAALAAVPGLIAQGITTTFGGQEEISWPYTHCVWNCWMTKLCGNGVAVVASLIKEVVDLGLCLANRDYGSCCSAFQPSDFADNASGRAAGKEYECCVKVCEAYGIYTDEPERPCGPFVGLSR